MGMETEAGSDLMVEICQYYDVRAIIYGNDNFSI
jgi:hypothetical protein